MEEKKNLGKFIQSKRKAKGISQKDWLINFTLLNCCKQMGKRNFVS